MTALALVAATLHICIALFQSMLAMGKPWGEFAWGGQHKGVLPLGLRVGSAFSVLLLVGFAFVNLGYAGLLPFSSLAGFRFVTAQKFVLGYSILAIIINAFSRSRKERLLWTPVALALAIINAVLLIL